MEQKKSFINSLDTVGVIGQQKKYYLKLWDRDKEKCCNHFFNFLENKFAGEPFYENALRPILLNRLNETAKKYAIVEKPPEPFTFERCFKLFPRWGDCMVEWDEAIAEHRAVF